MGKLSALWTFSIGGFQFNSSSVQIGGLDTSIVNGLRTASYFNVNDATRWMIGLSSFSFNGVSMGQAGLSDNVHFNILQDSISVPSRIYMQIAS